jgi:mRNA interferase RelE/StbE
MKLYQSYDIYVHRSARKFLDNLDIVERGLLVVKIHEMTTEKNTILDIKKLQGFKNLYRLRVGDYRIIFEPDRSIKVLNLFLIDYRRNIYAKLKHFKF